VGEVAAELAVGATAVAGVGLVLLHVPGARGGEATAGVGTGHRNLGTGVVSGDWLHRKDASVSHIPS
jgi:hypothetical protein